MSFLATGKWQKLFRIIRQNGGIFKSAYKLWRFETLKEGRYVGCDSNGNKYYTNNNYFIGRSRWVEHNINYRWDYDASQITSEWFGWLHYKTDKLPCEDCAKHLLQVSAFAQCWLQPSVENMTGTDKAYYPYSTTRPKVNIWDVDAKTRCRLQMKYRFAIAIKTDIDFDSGFGLLNFRKKRFFARRHS